MHSLKLQSDCFPPEFVFSKSYTDRGSMASGSMVLGSIAGHHHLHLGANNQDAGSFWMGNDLHVGVVADGCGSGEFSEVGARLAAHAVVHFAKQQSNAATTLAPHRFASQCMNAVSKLLDKVAPRGEGRPSFIREHLLHTILVAVLRREETFIFGVGDGLFCVNDVVTVLSAGRGNAPDYLAYRLLDISHPAFGAQIPTLHLSMATADLNVLWLGTDGAEVLTGKNDLAHDEEAEEQFERKDASLEAEAEIFRWGANDKLWKNPSLLTKKLRSSSQKGKLYDDTTLVGWRNS